MRDVSSCVVRDMRVLQHMQTMMVTTSRHGNPCSLSDAHNTDISCVEKMVLECVLSVKVVFIARSVWFGRGEHMCGSMCGSVRGFTRKVRDGRLVSAADVHGPYILVQIGDFMVSCERFVRMACKCDD